MSKISILLYALLLFSSCADKLPKVNVKREKGIDVLADSIYFSDLRCLTLQDGKLFISNVSDDQIICLDRDLALVTILGKKGQGPGELLGISQYAIKDSSLVVLNGGNNRINIYNTDNALMKEYSLGNNMIRFHTAYRFGFDGKQLIGCSSLAETPLATYNLETGEQTFWGEGYKFHLAVQSVVRNGRHTCLYENTYISVSDNMPYIEVYDANSHILINKYDYSQIDNVKKSLKAIEKRKNEAGNSYQIICDDIYVANGHLYLLFANIVGSYHVNEIIEFELNPQINPISIIKLPGEIYSSFCVSDSLLYAYNSYNNILEKFVMTYK